MQYITLGRTGLKTSVVGLGAGGFSRIGQSSGKSVDDSIEIVLKALDLGINFFDTAEFYKTEKIIGKAIEGKNRESIILSTKKSTWRDTSQSNVKKSLEKSLKNLGTEYVDIYHLHGVILDDYEHLASEVVPILLELRDQGKFKYLGITERFNADPQHKMLQRALDDDYWDVMMVGFNILNQSARERIFIKAKEKDIGILIMFAVRNAFSNPEKLQKLIRELIKSKQVDASELQDDQPLDFLIHKRGAIDLVDAAYRFCHYEPNTHVTLSGTGNFDHLKANIESFLRPPLPKEDTDKLKIIFKRVDSVSGQ
jgi:aryl-alcohol dehydrogenase-like predicted oxidoreductase